MSGGSNGCEGTILGGCDGGRPQVGGGLKGVMMQRYKFGKE